MLEWLIIPFVHHTSSAWYKNSLVRTIHIRQKLLNLVFCIIKLLFLSLTQNHSVYITIIRLPSTASLVKTCPRLLQDKNRAVTEKFLPLLYNMTFFCKNKNKIIEDAWIIKKKNKRIIQKIPKIPLLIAENDF